jgi:hypothetical protein
VRRRPRAIRDRAGIRGRIAALAVAAATVFAGSGLAGAQVPMPQPPPTTGAPAPPLPPGSAPSPILTRPGGLPFGPQPSYPASPYPAPLNQQEMQSYHTNLLTRQRRLEGEGVSPASPRYRAVQQQLNPLGR